MSNINNLSAILQLSEQAKNLSSLSKSINTMKSIIDSSSFDELYSTTQQLNNFLDTFGGFQSFSTLAKQMSAISKSLPKLDIPALTSGIKILDNIVELTPQAKETLDSLEEDLQIEETTEGNTTDPDSYKAPSNDTNSVNHSTYPDVKLTSSGNYTLSKSDFSNKYLPLLKFIAEAILIPIVLNCFLQPDISPLVDISQERLQVEEQRLETEQERNKLLNAQLEAALKNNELLEERLNADQKRNELLEG